MNNYRLNFNKGLRYQFNSLKAAVKKEEFDDITYEKISIMGYISAGYWTNIITEKEYHNLFRVVRKITKEFC